MNRNRKVDVSSVLSNPRTGVVQAYRVIYLKKEWTAIDRAVGADLSYLKSAMRGEISVTLMTAANDAWIVVANPVTTPPTTYHYGRSQRALTKLFVGYPDLEDAAFGIHDAACASRARLTLPPQGDPQRTGRPKAPVPLVLLVHGGPWGRDTYGFASEHQWLANRGYAVLAVNFRGSWGGGQGVPLRRRSRVGRQDA